MKHLILITNFFCKNKLKALALFIILLSNSIIIYTSIGFVNYREYSNSLFDRNKLKLSDYVYIYSQYDYQASFEFYDENGNFDTKSFNKKYADVVSDDAYHQIEQLSAVDKVLSYCVEDRGYNKYNDENISLMFSNEDTARFWEYDLSDGCWFWDAKGSGAYPNAVVCGSAFKKVKVYTDIEIIYNTNRYKIHVIGKVAAPYQTINISGEYSTGLTNENRIFFLDDEKSLKTFGSSIKRFPTSAIVKYKDGTDDDEIKACRNFYARYVYDHLNMEMLDVDDIICYTSTDDMFQNADSYLDSAKTEATVNILIFSLIALITFTILSILMAKVKQSEFCIYYFCGCTRKQSFLIFISGIFGVTLFAGIISSVVIFLHSCLVYNGVLSKDLSRYIISGNCYGFVWLFLLINMLLGTVIPFVMINKRNFNLVTFYKSQKV